MTRPIHEIDPRCPRGDEEKRALLQYLDSLEKRNNKEYVYVVELHPTFGQYTRAYPAEDVKRRLERFPKAVPTIADVITRKGVETAAYETNDVTEQTACQA